MLLGRPKGWSEKPPAGTGLNTALPTGTIGLWLFNEGLLPHNVARGGFGTVIGTRQASMTARGPVISHLAIDARSTLVEAVNSALIPTQGVTVCLGYEKRDATLRNAVAFGISTSTGTHRLQAYVPYLDGTVYWDFGGSTEDATRESAAGLTTSGYHTWGFTSGTRGMEIWQDGVRRSANAANPTRTNAGEAFQLGVGSATNGDFADYHWAFVHRFQLHAPLIREILLDPYNTLCTPQSPARRFVAVGVPPASAEGDAASVGTSTVLAVGGWTAASVGNAAGDAPGASDGEDANPDAPGQLAASRSVDVGYWPWPWYFKFQTAAINSSRIQWLSLGVAVGHRYGVVVAAPKTGTIHGYGYRSWVKQGGFSVRFSIQTVGTDGLPTGTGVDSGDILSSALVTSNLWQPVTMTSGLAVTRGDLIACCLELRTIVGPFPSAGSQVWLADETWGFPYLLTGELAGWAPNSGAGQTAIPSLALQYGTGADWQVPWGCLGSASSIGEPSGLVEQSFTAPWDVVLTGFVLDCQPTTDTTVALYDSTHALLRSATILANVRAGDETGVMPVTVTPLTLVSGELYYIALTQSGTSLRHFDVATVDVRAGSDAGASFGQTGFPDRRLFTTLVLQPFGSPEEAVAHAEGSSVVLGVADNIERQILLLVHSAAWTRFPVESRTVPYLPADFT